LTKEYFGLSNLSEEKLKETKIKLSISGKKRYSDFRNKTGNIFLRCILPDDTLYFYGYKDASRYFNIHHGAIRYAFKNSEGVVYKINAKFEKIDMDEYIRNKTTGEK